LADTGDEGDANDRFFLCYVETTRRCNLACPYCMSRLDAEPDGPELSTEEIKTRVLDELALARPSAAVAFSGGEALLREDCLEIVSHAGKRGLAVFLNTNGLALTDDVIPRLRDAAEGRMVVVLPLNSVEDAEQCWTRDDSSATVLDAAERCARHGVDHFFLVTVSNMTAGSLARTMRHLRRRQTPVLRAPFVPRGMGAKYPELLLTREIMEQKVHQALLSNPLCYISYTPFFAEPAMLESLWRQKGVRIEGLGCHAGRSFAAVSAEGEITPCVQLLDSAVGCGNVRGSRLSEVIDSHPIFLDLRRRDRFEGKCGRCRYRMSCGGCRALAHYVNGSILAEDPTCFFEPETPQTRSPFEEKANAGVREFIEFIKYNEPWNRLF